MQSKRPGVGGALCESLSPSNQTARQNGSIVRSRFAPLFRPVVSPRYLAATVSRIFSRSFFVALIPSSGLNREPSYSIPTQPR